jgi:hypothetical protein
LLGFLSATCLYWLQRLQPVFFAISLGALAYQGAIYYRRPKFLRTRGVKLILVSSVAINALVIGGWIFLWYRYR